MTGERERIEHIDRMERRAVWDASQGNPPHPSTLAGVLYKRWLLRKAEGKTAHFRLLRAYGHGYAA